MFDVFWIILNITIWIIVIILFFSLIIFAVRKLKWGWEIFVMFLFFTIITLNNTKDTKRNNNIIANENILKYSDVISLNIFQNNNIYIYDNDYSSTIVGLNIGIYWDDIVMQIKSMNEEKIEYHLEKRKSYLLLNIPVFSKIEIFQDEIISNS